MHPDDEAAINGLPEPVDAVRAEVAAEPTPEPVAVSEIPDGAIAVPICGEIVHILDPASWFSSSMTALHQGDYDSWAEECLAPGDYANVWCQLNDGRGPRISEVTGAMEVYQRLTGQDLGKSRPSLNSLRRTQMR